MDANRRIGIYLDAVTHDLVAFERITRYAEVDLVREHYRGDDPLRLADAVNAGFAEISRHWHIIGARRHPERRAFSVTLEDVTRAVAWSRR
jgi:hypothetical protein